MDAFSHSKGMAQLAGAGECMQGAATDNEGCARSHAAAACVESMEQLAIGCSSGTPPRACWEGCGDGHAHAGREAGNGGMEGGSSCGEPAACNDASVCVASGASASGCNMEHVASSCERAAHGTEGAAEVGDEVEAAEDIGGDGTVAQCVWGAGGDDGMPAEGSAEDGASEAT